MSQCLRCSRLCSATAVFCDECRSLLRSQLQQGELASSVASMQTVPLVALLAQHAQSPEILGDSLERITGPQPVIKGPQTPLPPVSPSYENTVERAISRLDEAARRIEEVEQNDPGGLPASGRRVPRASRLAPLADISADIRRESTPLPASMRPENESGVENKNVSTSTDISSFTTGSNPASGSKASGLSNADFPDLWPWLDTDTDENETDSWTNRTDPLLSRHFPNSTESARIEEEDIRRAVAEGLGTGPFPATRTWPSRMRIGFLVLALLAVLALVLDGVLVFLGLAHSRHHVTVQSGPPTLTLSNNQARLGDTLTITISHFTASTKVLLTHDVEEPLQTLAGSSLVNIGQNGDAKVKVLVDESFGPGFHMIEAEDVTSRLTASAMLQIIGSGPTRPAHLQLDATSLDMGANFQGVNTIQFLTLINAGGGSISWSASTNSPWLLLSPASGLFSQSQKISVAAQRGSLKPGDYKGTITFDSNVGSPQQLSLTMTVLPLPPHVALLEVTPALLSFTATDAGANPASQVLTVTNPGSQPLYWSLAVNPSSSLATPTQSSLFHALGLGANNWLTTSLASGSVQPGQSQMLMVNIQSSNLLPGVYMGAIEFSAGRGALNSGQSVDISLTIQPRCGIVVSSGSLTFNTVAGQSNPSNQALTLNGSTSCSGMNPWTSISSASWLSITPSSGQLKGTTGTITSVAVNAAGLKPGKYPGTITISFMNGQSTQSVLVTLNVQAPPPPAAPVIAAAPLNLNFSNTQGQPNPAGQLVTITNNGGGALYWHPTVTPLVSPWLSASPTGGMIAPGQTGQVTITVNTSTLTPGTYVGQVSLDGTDARGEEAAGSQQTVMVNLVVQPPCAMQQPSASSLSFNATPGASASPAAQTVTITGSGSCAWPLTWSANAASSASWLQLSSSSGKIMVSGQSATFTATANVAGLAVGTYSTQITITATDSSGNHPLGSPQNVSVNLAILQPCVLQLSTSTLTFNGTQGAAVNPQSFTISESGNCALPLSWTASADTGWITLSATSGSDSGSGTPVSVSVNTLNLSAGSYTGHINVSATDNGGQVIQAAAPITVNLIVTASLSGTIVGCADTTCATPVTLSQATVSLLNGPIQLQSLVANSSDNYSFSFTNVPSGTYVINVTATDSNGVQYTGSLTLTVSDDQTGLTIKVLPAGQ